MIRERVCIAVCNTCKCAFVSICGLTCARAQESACVSACVFVIGRECLHVCMCDMCTSEHMCACISVIWACGNVPTSVDKCVPVCAHVYMYGQYMQVRLFKCPHGNAKISGQVGLCVCSSLCVCIMGHVCVCHSLCVCV